MSSPSKSDQKDNLLSLQKQEEKNKIKLSLTEKKDKIQWIWRLIFIFITLSSTIFLHKIYQYQTMDYFKDIRKGCLLDLIVIGIPLAIVFVVSDFLSHQMFDPMCQKYYISHSKYTNPEARKKRCYTIVKWGFSIFYYTLTSIAAYFILIETSFMPTWLGGNGDCTDCLRYIESFEQATQTMKIYYGVQFGKHLGRLFQHVFVRPEGSFYQYTLHHALSTFLIFFSFMMNFWIIGIFILFIHDISDALLIIPRAYRDYKKINKPFLILQYLAMMISWISCRIFMLSYCAVYTSIRNLYKVAYHPEILDPTIIEVMYLPSAFMAVMLSALEVLQIFWTYHIITSFIEVSVSNKIAKHTYD